MYVLKIANTEPPMYIGLSDGFFEKVDSKSGALQLGRMQDAQDMQQLIVETVVPESV